MTTHPAPVPPSGDADSRYPRRLRSDEQGSAGVPGTPQAVSGRLGTATRMTEAQFQGRIIDTARRLGWRVHHSPRSVVRGRTMTAVVGHPGLPDLILARSGVLILAELKVGRNKPSAQQLEWLAALGPFGRLWRPEDWDTEILPTLRGAA